jgi:ureidoacrylate peracid hydrolase
MNIEGYTLNPALIVIDLQNGFVSKGGSYYVLGMNILPYNDVIY